MTDEQLVQAIQKGEAQPIELWLQMRNLFRKMARRYLKDDKDPLMDDLMQESYFALLDAIRLYDPENGMSFSKYSSYWIKRYMLRYRSQSDTTVRLPVNVHTRVMKYKTMCKEFMRDFGRMPTDDEVVTAIGVDKRQVERDEQMLTIGSTDATIKDIEDLTVGDVVADDSVDVEAEVLDAVAAEELRNKIWSLVDTLPEQQAQVIRKRYQEGKTQKQCGEDLEVTTSRVQVVEAAALRSLRRGKIRRQLEPFVDDIRYSKGIRGRWQYYDGERYSSTELAAIKASAYLNKLQRDGLI